MYMTYKCVHVQKSFKGSIPGVASEPARTSIEQSQMVALDINSPPLRLTHPIQIRSPQPQPTIFAIEPVTDWRVKVKVSYRSLCLNGFESQNRPGKLYSFSRGEIVTLITFHQS